MKSVHLASNTMNGKEPLWFKQLVGLLIFFSFSFFLFKWIGRGDWPVLLISQTEQKIFKSRHIKTQKHCELRIKNIKATFTGKKGPKQKTKNKVKKDPLSRTQKRGTKIIKISITRWGGEKHNHHYPHLLRESHVKICIGCPLGRRNERRFLDWRRGGSPSPAAFKCLGGFFRPPFLGKGEMAWVRFVTAPEGYCFGHPLPGGWRSSPAIHEVPWTLLQFWLEGDASASNLVLTSGPQTIIRVGLRGPGSTSHSRIREAVLLPGLCFNSGCPASTTFKMCVLPTPWIPWH